MVIRENDNGMYLTGVFAHWTLVDDLMNPWPSEQRYSIGFGQPVAGPGLLPTQGLQHQI